MRIISTQETTEVNETSRYHATTGFQRASPSWHDSGGLPVNQLTTSARIRVALTEFMAYTYMYVGLSVECNSSVNATQRNATQKRHAWAAPDPDLKRKQIDD